MQSDIEIAQAAQPQRIDAIAEKAGIDDKYLEMYGKYKAKVDYNLLRDNEHTPGKLVLVTAINPPRRSAWPMRSRSAART